MTIHCEQKISASLIISNQKLSNHFPRKISILKVCQERFALSGYDIDNSTVNTLRRVHYRLQNAIYRLNCLVRWRFCCAKDIALDPIQ